MARYQESNDGDVIVSGGQLLQYLTGSFLRPCRAVDTFGFQNVFTSD